MNMILVDVPDIDGVKRGSEVVTIGQQEGSEISIASFSEMMNYLNYEVLVRIQAKLPRFVGNSTPGERGRPIYQSL